MPSSEQHSVSRLLKAVEKLGIFGAVFTILILVGLYYWIASSNPSSDLANNNVSRELSLTLIAGLIPVILLFIFSFTLFKEINAFKDREKTNDISNEVAAKIVRTLETSFADAFFSSNTDEKFIIESAEHELLMIQESGSRVSETYSSETESFLRRGGILKIIVVTPNTTVANLMVLRNSTLDSVTAFKDRTKKFKDHVDKIRQNSNAKAHQIQLRFISYPICFTMMMSDTQSLIESRKSAVIRLAGFKVPYDHKLDFSISRETSTRIYDHYHTQFKNMWHNTSKVIVITGSPRSGKSSLMSKLEQNVAESQTYYAISHEILDSAQLRIGFKVSTTGQPEGREFARKDGIDAEYILNQNVWDKVAEEIDAAINNGTNVFLIDEAGPMQNKSSKFCSSIERLLTQDDITLVITAADDSHSSTNSLASNVKNNCRSTVLTLSNETRDATEEQVKEELINR